MFSKVAEITLVASENTRDINRYRFYLATCDYIYKLINLNMHDKNTMFNINQTYRFSQHDPAINRVLQSNRKQKTKVHEHRTYIQCSETN